MDFIDAGTVLELLDKKAEEMLERAATEEKRAAGNLTLVGKLRFTAANITGIRNEIGLMLALPGYPDPEPPAAESTDPPIGEELDPTKEPACGFIVTEPGQMPEENGVDPNYEAGFDPQPEYEGGVDPRYEAFVADSTPPLKETFEEAEAPGRTSLPGPDANGNVPEVPERPTNTTPPTEGE